jgi:hypothetical protein
MVLKTPSALAASLRNVPPTVVLADTLIVTALLLGLVGAVGLVGLLRRRAHGARHGR